MVYLSRRALEGLKAYEYKPSGYTYLDRIHTPFWECECLAGCGPGPRWRRSLESSAPPPARCCAAPAADVAAPNGDVWPATAPGCQYVA